MAKTPKIEGASQATSKVADDCSMIVVISSHNGIFTCIVGGKSIKWLANSIRTYKGR
jgi:hypothetical protein